MYNLHKPAVGWLSVRFGTPTDGTPPRGRTKKLSARAIFWTPSTKFVADIIKYWINIFIICFWGLFHKGLTDYGLAECGARAPHSVILLKFFLVSLVWKRKCVRAIKIIRSVLFTLPVGKTTNRTLSPPRFCLVEWWVCDPARIQSSWWKIAWLGGGGRCQFHSEALKNHSNDMKTERGYKISAHFISWQSHPPIKLLVPNYPTSLFLHRSHMQVSLILLPLRRINIVPSRIWST